MIALTLGLSMTLSAQAHMLWLERGTDMQTHAFFGEYSEQLKETQQGALKSFNQAKAVQAKKTFQSSNATGSFALCNPRPDRCPAHS